MKPILFLAVLAVGALLAGGHAVAADAQACTVRAISGQFAGGVKISEVVTISCPSSNAHKPTIITTRFNDPAKWGTIDPAKQYTSSLVVVP
jgi:hypothetical protein